MKPKLLITLSASALLAFNGYCATLNWISTDVGTPTLQGSATVNGDGSVTIVGGGDDIWNAADNCHYYYAWGSGKTWDAIVEVDSLVGPDYWTKCELMVRVSDPINGPKGPDAFLADMATQITYNNGTAAENAVIDQYRTKAGGSADWKQAGNNPAPVYPGTWMGIHRATNIFSIYYYFGTTDPGKDFTKNWNHYMDIDTSTTTLVGQDNGTTFGTPFPDIVAVGVAVTAHNNTDPTGGIATIRNLYATFPPLQPPTKIGVSQQIQPGGTNYFGAEASLSFSATNDASPVPIGCVYQWYKNGTPVAGATGSDYTWLLQNTDNGAQVFCRASCPAPYTTVPTLDSAIATIGVTPATYYTNGLKMEFFAGNGSASPGRVNVENGIIGPATWESIRPNFDDPGNYGNYYVSRVSGWFIAPATTTYTFFLAGDDDTDLFLSTDTNPAHKQMIAQETGWSGMDSWLTAGGGAFAAPINDSQKRSDQWVPDPNNPPVGGPPFANGIALTAGQLYYIEAVHSQGTGGDSLGVTYQTAANMTDPNWATVFTNGVPSLMQAASNCLVLVSHQATTLTWVTQPADTVAAQGFNAKFSAQAASDSEFAPLYQWYRDGNPVVGATSASYSFQAAQADSGATFTVVASTALGELSITSSVPAKLTVVPPVFERGVVKADWWMNSITSRGAVEGGTAPAPTYTLTTPRFEAGVNNENGDNYVNRVSGFFMPATTGNYTFFVCSDDQSDLYISTDDTPAHKYMVAQETGWSGVWNWLTVGGGSNLAQKRSDQFVDPNNGSTYPNGIPLQAGQKYYMEVVHTEGGGGDNVEATFIKVGDADPANGTDSAFVGNLIGMNAPFCHYVAFSQEPANTTVPFGAFATFSAAGTTDSQIAVGTTGLIANSLNNYIMFQWQKNGVDIAGANGSSYSFGPVSPLDNGMQISCKIRAIGLADTSGNPIWSNSTPATLTVSGTPVFESGFALHEFWSQNPTRAQMETGTAGAPSWVTATPSFEIGANGEMGDNYGNALFGFFIPQVSGNYVFFDNSDDDSDLFLSTDGSASNKRLIAQETAYANGPRQWGTTHGVIGQERSDTFVDPATGTIPYANGIALVKGQKYFMMAAHHEGGGGDYVCVNAKLVTDPDPAGGTPSVITGPAVGFYAAKCTYVTFTNEPQSLTVNNYDSATFAANGTTDSTTPVGPNTDPRNYTHNFLFFQWFENGKPIAGATSSALTIPVVMPSENGAQIFCAMRALGYGDSSGNPLWATSSVVTLGVNTSAPHLVYEGSYWNSNYVNFGVAPTNYITLAFDFPMDPAALSQMSSYSVGNGLTLLAVLVNSNDYRSVNLAVTGSAPPGTVTITGPLKGMGGGLALANNTLPVAAAHLINMDIGVPGSDPIIPTVMWVRGVDAYSISAEGSDIWNAADGFNFAYEKKTGDFDVVVRQKKISHTSNWAKGGLMVRETLDAGSRNWNIVNDPLASDGIMAPDGSGMGASAVECNCRNMTNGTSGGWQIVTNAPPAGPAYPNAWIRLKRTGNILTSYWSTDGVVWAQEGYADPTTVGDSNALPATVYIGLCTTAHNNDAPGADPLLYVNNAEYDSYNSAFVPISVVTVKATVVGGNIQVSWTPNVGQLFSSPKVGPGAVWTAEAAGNPVTIPITSTTKFFRVGQ